jgi:hypothetical protein
MLLARGTVLTGLGVGAGLMFFLDPDRGARRRALVKDKLVRSVNLSSDALEAATRDLSHRTTGVIAHLRKTAPPVPVEDAVLADRVRGELDRLVSHPRAVEVQVVDQRVTLSGPVIQSELRQLLRGVRRIDGVRSVVNALEGHLQPNDVPALQGGSTLRALRPDTLYRRWTPATRVFVGTAAAGLGILAGAVANRQLRRLA